MSDWSTSSSHKVCHIWSLRAAAAVLFAEADITQVLLAAAPSASPILHKEGAGKDRSALLLQADTGTFKRRWHRTWAWRAAAEVLLGPALFAKADGVLLAAALFAAADVAAFFCGGALGFGAAPFPLTCT